MPYEKLTDLPERVRSNLPKHAQEINQSVRIPSATLPSG
jgi:cation transport regulator ChaB